MKRQRASLAILLFLVLAGPQAPDHLFLRPSHTALSANPSQTACFGRNGVNDSYIPGIVGGLRIALIQPILTATPYSQYPTGSFYAFYADEKGVTTNVTTHLDLLSTNVSSGYTYHGGWGNSYGEYKFFTSPTAVNCGLQVGKNVQILTDIDVANGALFDSQNNKSRFDVVVLPFSEYVETSEYVAYENFVAGGGNLVIMGHSLEYPVTYNATTNFETLVYAHNWAFNGKYAYPIACGSNTYVETCPWAKNNTNWTGSNTCEASCFHTYTFNGSVVNVNDPIGRALYDEFGGTTVFNSYVSHEENTVTNMSHTSIVAVLANDSRNLIASYTHQFRRGTVVCFGFFGDDIIATDASAQYFMLQGIIFGKPGATVTSSTTTTVTSSDSSTSNLTRSSTTQTSSSTTLSSQRASSALEQTSTSATVTSTSPGPLPPVLVALGGIAAVFGVAGALVFHRRRPAKIL